MKLIDYLLGFQKKAASTVVRFLILLWSRQTGKGFTTSFVASRGAMVEPRSKWLIVAPTERRRERGGVRGDGESVEEQGEDNRAT